MIVQQYVSVAERGRCRRVQPYKEMGPKHQQILHHLSFLFNPCYSCGILGLRCAMETVFTKIRAGAIPSAKVYEDEICFVILDINPVNKGHLLIITNEVHPTLADTPDEVLSHLLVIAKKADAKLREVLGCAATNVVINNGEASGQEIPHLHLHIIPRYTDDGKRLTFPKTHYDEGEIAALGKRLEFE